MLSNVTRTCWKQAVVFYRSSLEGTLRKQTSTFWTRTLFLSTQNECRQPFISLYKRMRSQTYLTSLRKGCMVRVRILLVHQKYFSINVHSVDAPWLECSVFAKLKFIHEKVRNGTALWWDNWPFVFASNVNWQFFMFTPVQLELKWLEHDKGTSWTNRL